MLVFLFIVNSIDYTWINQRGLIGELVGGGEYPFHDQSFQGYH